jgi:hypothetical protein
MCYFHKVRYIGTAAGSIGTDPYAVQVRKEGQELGVTPDEPIRPVDAESLNLRTRPLRWLAPITTKGQPSLAVAHDVLTDSRTFTIHSLFISYNTAARS